MIGQTFKGLTPERNVGSRNQIECTTIGSNSLSVARTESKARWAERVSEYSRIRGGTFSQPKPSCEIKSVSRQNFSVCRTCFRIFSGGEIGERLRLNTFAGTEVLYAEHRLAGESRPLIWRCPSPQPQLCQLKSGIHIVGVRCKRPIVGPCGGIELPPSYEQFAIEHCAKGAIGLRRTHLAFDLVEIRPRKHKIV